jgi:hypothetical protein
MLDVFLVKILFHLSVLELGSIITSYLLGLGIKLILDPLQELLEHLLGFTLIIQKEYPSKT